MSSRDGFAHADVDVSFYSDPKLMRLRRDLSDDDAFARACTVYLSTLLASWRENRRLTADESSVIRLSETDAGALIGVGLLDADGRIPEHAWINWHSAAEARRAAGQKAANARWGGRGHKAVDADALPSKTESIAPAKPVRQARQSKQAPDGLCTICSLPVSRAEAVVVDRAGDEAHSSCVAPLRSALLA